jgi:glutaredoxin 3|tara:strand:- start:3189 stop:3461 length:273 start_codon:yes stop_codon:yes gene_type:complete
LLIVKKEEKKMKKVEVFSAGCSACEGVISEVNDISGSKEVVVLDMKDPSVSSRAKSLGIESVPAILVDGKLAECCAGRGVNLKTIQAAVR